MSELKVIVVCESLLDSIIADIFTVGFLLLGLYINCTYLGNSTTANVFLVFALLIMSFKSGNKKVKRMDKRQAYEYLKKELGEDI